MQTDWRKSRWFATLCATYLCLIAIPCVFVSLFAAPSFWYVPCSILLILSIYLWRNPSEGASASFPIALTFTIALVILELLHHAHEIIIFIGLFALGVAMCIIILDATGISRRWLAASVGLVALSFAVDYFFTNQVHIVTLQAHYSIDGTTPWGDDARRDSKGDAGVMVYTKVGGGYCYDTVFYAPLKKSLVAEKPFTVTVQYNVFSDFGHERSYNIRSINGLQFNDDKHNLIDADSEGGTSLNSGSASPTCPR
jgi:hypothetical protein